MITKVVWKEMSPSFRCFEVDQDTNFCSLSQLCKTAFELDLSCEIKLFYLDFGEKQPVRNDADWKKCFEKHMSLTKTQEQTPELLIEMTFEVTEPFSFMSEEKLPTLPINQPSNQSLQSSIDSMLGSLFSQLNSLNQDRQADQEPTMASPESGLEFFKQFLKELPNSIVSLKLASQLITDKEKSANNSKWNYKVAKNSPASAATKGPPETKSTDEFFLELRSLNPLTEQLELIDAVEPLVRNFESCLQGSARPDSPLVECLLKVSKALGGRLKPRVHQTFAVISALLKPKDRGLVLQIATGEGKSLIGRMLAACLVLHCKLKVDMVSSAANLVEREIEESSDFYKLLKCIVGSCIGFHEKYKSKAERDANNVYITSQLLCGTVHEFSANHLRDLLNTQLYTPPPALQAEHASFSGKHYSDCRPGSFLIIDEVDNMFIDEQNHSTKIVSERKGLQAFDLCLFDISSKLRQLFTAKPPSQDEAVKALEKAFKDESYISTMNFSKEERKKWDKKCRHYFCNAHRALYCMHENQDYVIEGNEVKIVDRSNTGEVKNNSRWGEGLHELIELKHNLPMKRSTEASFERSPVSFFDSYGSNLFGMTGTLGDQATTKFLKDTYKLITIDIPRSNKNRKVLYEPIFEKSSDNLRNQPAVSDELRDFVCTQLALGRPCLIVSSTIDQASQQSNQLPAMVRKQVGVNIKPIVFTRQDTANVHESIQKVSPRDVIFATALAGRGTDIKLTEEAKQNGGLAVVINYLPDSIRTQRQIEGRSGRNGENGSSIMIFSDTRHSQFNTADHCIQMRDRLEENQLAQAAQSVQKIREEEAGLANLRQAIIEVQTKNPRLVQVILDKYLNLKQNSDLVKEKNSEKIAEFNQTLDQIVEDANQNKDTEYTFSSPDLLVNNVAMSFTEKIKDLQTLKTQITEANKHCTNMQKKELSLLEAVAECNLGSSEKALQILKEIEVIELEESMYINAKSDFEVMSKNKSVVDNIAYEIKQIQEPKIMLAASQLDQNFTQENCEKFVNEIQELAKSYPILKVHMDIFNNLEPIKLQAELNLKTQKRAHFEVYNLTKEKAKKVIEFNNSCNSDKDKLALYMKENCHEIKDLDIALKNKKDPENMETGYLGYIIGGLMIAGGIGALCCFNLGMVGTRMALEFIEAGGNQIVDNHLMNISGNYSHGKVLLTTLRDVIQITCKPRSNSLLKPGNLVIDHSRKLTISPGLNKMLALSYSISNTKNPLKKVSLAITVLTNLGKMLSTKDIETMEKETENAYKEACSFIIENHNKAIDEDNRTRENLIILTTKAEELAAECEQDLNQMIQLSPTKTLLLSRSFEKENMKSFLYQFYMESAQKVINEEKEHVTTEALSRVAKLTDLKSLDWSAAKKFALSKLKKKLNCESLGLDNPMMKITLIESLSKSLIEAATSKFKVLLETSAEQIVIRIKNEADRLHVRIMSNHAWNNLTNNSNKSKRPFNNKFSLNIRTESIYSLGYSMVKPLSSG